LCRKPLFFTISHDEGSQPRFIRQDQEPYKYPQSSCLGIRSRTERWFRNWPNLGKNHSCAIIPIIELGCTN